MGSFPRQTYTNFELILISDGSTDSSGQICDHLANRVCQNIQGLPYQKMRVLMLEI